MSIGVVSVPTRVALLLHPRGALRRVLFDNESNVQLLRDAIAKVQAEMPFEIDAAVVLSDHMHFIWSLPPDNANLSFLSLSQLQ